MATIGQQLLNFATEFLADEALECAKSLDEYYKNTGKIKGPLHGVPISVKEHVGIGGKICNTGYVSWISNIAVEDALTIQLLRKSGAVILLRTNEPQSLMHGDTNNNITGITLNPTNRTLSAGGSSGGEGSCIAFKGSAIGVGTDIGGSIRIPSSFNGVYGFRPTALRLPYKGVHTVAGGQEALRSVIGPLSRSVDDLELFMRSVLQHEPWDIEVGLAPLLFCVL
ncbi:amidase signature enzyme [Lophium mytilinum]|uniref:amidase n=1 Tax=Lophium mytilinum TaxID=390894 RepID=A0A6A6QE87_9PEZI|nr:amidase signature enzyme [Lophium mytilinum]